jgi:hypothetical protein
MAKFEKITKFLLKNAKSLIRIIRGIQQNINKTDVTAEPPTRRHSSTVSSANIMMQVS